MDKDFKDRRYFMVYRADDSIDMTLVDEPGQHPLGRTVSYDVWCAVLPILGLEPARLSELTAIDVEDAVDVGFDDELRSLYSLLGILAATGSPTRAAAVARGWALLPWDMRWRNEADCDKPLHAQILGLTSTSAVSLDSVVPDWLFKLVRTSRGLPLLRDDSELHWTSAATLLGKSCVAWTDDDETNPAACLAISDCGIAFLRSDDPSLSHARSSIEMLFDSLNTIIVDPEIAKEINWTASGHETLEIQDVLTAWMARLDAAAEAAAASGWSTRETWDWIGQQAAGK